MTLSCVAEDRVIPREQHGSELAGRGHDESISGISMKDARKAATADADGRCKGYEGKSRYAECLFDPFLAWDIKAKPAPRIEHADLPGGNCTDAQKRLLPCELHELQRFGPDAQPTFHQPYPDMGVQ
jgi:hypothetical protein